MIMSINVMDEPESRNLQSKLFRQMALEACFYLHASDMDRSFPGTSSFVI